MNVLVITGGIIAVFFGFFGLYYIIKHPIKREEDTNMHNYQIVVGWLLLIALGIVLVYREINNVI
ncbi:MAG: hypothetical protein M3Q58_11430 [Bacteroidota bacterium]|nr:hypothetical protein [Bacteroidota bacterium]